MKRFIGAAVAAIALACAGSASAAVLLQKSGTVDNSYPLLTMAELWPFLTEKGSEIEIVLNYTSTTDVGATPRLLYWSYRTYPDGWQEPLSTDEGFPLSGSGHTRTWDWATTATNLTMRLRQSDYSCQDWEPGMRCLWEVPISFYFALRPDSDLKWDLTVNTFDGGSAVPEPATWAMMIIGFGALGALVRRRQAAMLQNIPI